MGNFFLELLTNKPLIAGLTAWSLGQIIKLPIEYMFHKKWDWSLLFSTGGMPSTHSAMISAVTLAIGLYHGFDGPAFSIAMIITMIVVYDAAGIRRQAGLHAEKINTMINELLSGHPVNDTSLKELLGHSPGQVTGGIIFGILVALLFWLTWP